MNWFAAPNYSVVMSLQCIFVRYISAVHLLFHNTEMTKHNLLDQFAKQDQTTVCHIDKSLSHTKQQVIL